MSTAIKEFLAWWVAGLAVFVPARFRRQRRRLGAHVLVTPTERGFDLAHITGESTRGKGPPAGKGPAGHGLAIDGETAAGRVRAWLAEHRAEEDPVLLRVPAETVLCRALTLPAVAPDSLRAVLGFEIDRQTPFARDQVYFAYRILRHRPATRQLELELVVAPRTVVDGLTARLAVCGIAPAIIDTAALPYEEHGVSLYTRPAAAAAEGRGRRSLVYAAALCVLVAVLVAVPFLQARQRIAELETREHAVRADAAAVAALRKRREALLDQQRFIEVARGQAPGTLRILDELTHLLPDDSWITRFELKSGGITIQGESGSASSLIRLLQESALVEDARFISPITPNMASGKERFRISMTLASGDAA